MPETKTYTPAGFKALQDELDYLVNVRVEENKKEISTARAFGDLSENSEYDEAKQEQGKIHARIDELREMIAHAKVIDESQIDESKISVGSIVVLYNVERAKEFTVGRFRKCHGQLLNKVCRRLQIRVRRGSRHIDIQETCKGTCRARRPRIL